MRIKVFVCPKCGSGIFARAQGDFRTCTCYAIGVSGGPQTPSLSVGSALAPKVKSIDLDIKASAAKLEEDWSDMTDAFGLIAKEDSRLKGAKPLKAADLVAFTQPKQTAGAPGEGEGEEGEDLEEGESEGGEEVRAEEA